MRKIFILLILVPSFVLCSFAQNTESYKSVVSAKQICCADSASVDFGRIKVKELKGNVRTSVNINDSIILEIYKFSKDELKEKSLLPVINKMPLNTFEINKNGEFYIEEFPEGYYVLKFGTESGGWNCSWIIVEVSKKSRDRKIEVSLELGH